MPENQVSFFSYFFSVKSGKGGVSMIRKLTEGDRQSALQFVSERYRKMGHVEF